MLQGNHNNTMYNMSCKIEGITAAYCKQTLKTVALVADPWAYVLNIQGIKALNDLSDLAVLISCRFSCLILPSACKVFHVY